MDYSIRLFVYDNLRQNEQNHHLLKGAEPLHMQSWIKGKLLDTDAGYPVAAESESDHVYGEVYQISKKQLREITQYLIDNPFQGKVVKKKVCTDQGNVEAYTAVFPKSLVERLDRVEYGDWKCHLKLEDEEFSYFAYGSCMDKERMEKAGVDSLFERVEGRGMIYGYSLGYTIKGKDGGRADIIETGKGAVEGKVYRVNKDAMHYLFTREGVHGKRYRPAFIDLYVNGKLRRDVLTFIVMEKCEEIAPPEHYALEILRGAKGLVSDEYYEKLHTNLVNKFEMSVPVR